MFFTIFVAYGKVVAFVIKHEYARAALRSVTDSQINHNLVEFLSAFQLTAILLFSARRRFVERLTKFIKDAAQTSRKEEADDFSDPDDHGGIYCRFSALFFEQWNFTCILVIVGTLIILRIEPHFLRNTSGQIAIADTTPIIQTFPLQCAVLVVYFILAQFAYIRRTFGNWKRFKKQIADISEIMNQQNASFSDDEELNLLIDFKKINDGIFATMVLRPLYEKFACYLMEIDGNKFC